jgi:DNA-binding MarR family transcriptional regulator
MPNIEQLEEQMTALVRAFGLHKAGLTPCGQPFSVSEAHALSEVERHGRLSQTELSARLRLDKSTVSRLVKKLEKVGWFLRERVDPDNRVVVLRLSPQGQAVASRLTAARKEKFERILDNLSTTDQINIVESITVLVGAIDKTVDS